MEKGPNLLKVYSRKQWKKKTGREVLRLTIEESRIGQLELVSRKWGVVGENIRTWVSREEKNCSAINKNHSEEERSELIS